MGPSRTLLTLGATVLAVDLDGRPQMWAALEEFAAASPGKLIIPTSTSSTGNVGGKDEAVDGCNVLTDFEGVADWIVGNSGGSRIVLGSFLYADGALFARHATSFFVFGLFLVRKRQSVCKARNPVPSCLSQTKNRRSLRVIGVWSRAGGLDPRADPHRHHVRAH
jgi:hypothetical protein